MSTDPASDLGSGRLLGATRRRADEEREERLAIRRAANLGLFIWPAFVLLDVYMTRVAMPGVPFARLFGCRMAGEAVILAAWAAARRPSTSIRLVRFANRGMAYAAASLISIMALWLGALNSPYVHGLSIVLLVMAVVIPSPWRRSLVLQVPTALAFPVVMGLAALGDAGVRASLHDAPRLALFGANYVFVLAAAVIGSICGHLVWAARRQVYEARRLGRYRLKVPVGEGGMNEVWLAWDDTLKRDVALKILRVSETTDNRMVERFVREARAMSRLTSPHTIRVFDFGASDDGVYYIAMEYLTGADLQRLVQLTGPLPPGRVVHFARQACLSLLEAHAAGIVHRDIKPANLFAARIGHEYDVLKILDFGIARVRERMYDVTHSQSIAGTPDYMAPEVWSGGTVDARSDIYSLGGTLYFLLSGATPFHHSEGFGDLARAHVGEAPAAPSSRRGQPLPPQLEAIVLRCLEKSPERRFQNSAELLQALTTCADEWPWRVDNAAAAWVQAFGSGAGELGLDSPRATA